MGVITGVNWTGGRESRQAKVILLGEATFGMGSVLCLVFPHEKFRGVDNEVVQFVR